MRGGYYLPAGLMDQAHARLQAGRPYLQHSWPGPPHGPWRSRKIKSQPSPSADQLWARYMGIWIRWTTVRIYSAKLQPTSLTMSTLLPLSSFALIGSKQAQSSNLSNTCTDQLVLHMKTGMTVMLCEKKFSLCSHVVWSMKYAQDVAVAFCAITCEWNKFLVSTSKHGLCAGTAHMVQTRNLIQPGYTS